MKGDYIIDNIMNSTALMKSWADRIVANCGNTAIVNFSVDQTDYEHSYYIQSNGTTKLGKCIDPEDALNTLPWGVLVCL